jgi:hypothetical protein
MTSPKWETFGSSIAACLVADTPPEVSFVAVENLCVTGEGPSRAPQQNIYYKTEGSLTVSSLSGEVHHLWGFEDSQTAE